MDTNEKYKFKLKHVNFLLYIFNRNHVYIIFSEFLFNYLDDFVKVLTLLDSSLEVFFLSQNNKDTISFFSY